MSRANGLIKFKDGSIKWTIYNGTVDQMHPLYYNTNEEAWKGYKHDDYPEVCKHEKETVEIYSDYGGGFYWEGKCCTTCKSIGYDYTDPYGDEITGENRLDYTDGMPEWVKEFFNKINYEYVS